MPGDRERVGFIFECGHDGPDYQVCRHFLERLNPELEMVPSFLDSKLRLREDCGPVAAALLAVDRCSRVVVAWDLEPAWGGKACRHDDKELAWASLRQAEVPLDRVVLLCVERELECWLMADTRALTAVLGRLKHPHQVGSLPVYRKPDREIGRPKTALVGIFERELGRGRKYVDRNHALLLAEAVPDWGRIRRSASFRRFAEKAAGVVIRDSRVGARTQPLGGWCERARREEADARRRQGRFRKTAAVVLEVRRGRFCGF